MSHESDSDRIRRLESQVAQLVGIQNGFLKYHSAQAGFNSMVAKGLVSLKNDNVSVLRFLVQTNLAIDEKSKQEFFDKVARMERECEIMEALVAEMNAKHDIEPPMPPSSPPEAN
jgi:hypothetical protein